MKIIIIASLLCVMTAAHLVIFGAMLIGGGSVTLTETNIVILAFETVVAFLLLVFATWVLISMIKKGRGQEELR